MKTKLMTSLGGWPLAFALTTGAVAEPLKPADPAIKLRTESRSAVSTEEAQAPELKVRAFQLAKPPEAVEGKGAPADAAGRLRALERELADLNAASERRRKELMRQMAATRAAVEKQKAARQQRQVRSLTQWMNAPGSPPEWVIGVAIQAADDKGIVVGQVMEKKAGARAGLQAGDVIRACNGIILRNREALVQIIQAAQDQELRLLVQRGSGEDAKEIEIAVTPERSESAAANKGAMGGYELQPDPRAGGSVQPAPGAWQAIPGGEFPFTYHSYVSPRQAGQDKEIAEIKKLLEQVLKEMKSGQAE